MRSSVHVARRRSRAVFAAPNSVFTGRLLDFFARRFRRFQKTCRLRSRMSATSFTASALAQRGQQAFFRARIPQPVQRVAHLAARHAQPMCRDATLLHLVRLVENHEVVLEQNAAFDFLVNAAEQREKQRVVQHQHVRRKEFCSARAERNRRRGPWRNRTGSRKLSASTSPRSEQTCAQTFGSGSTSKSDRLPSLVSFDHS